MGEVLIGLVILASLLVGVAYQLLPYRFGLPILALLLGAWFTSLALMSRDGLSDAEGQQLLLSLLVGLAPFLVATQLTSMLRRRARA